MDLHFTSFMELSKPVDVQYHGLMPLNFDFQGQISAWNGQSPTRPIRLDFGLSLLETALSDLK